MRWRSWSAPVRPVEAEDLDCSLIGDGEAFADFNGGGLPCPVGAEEAETLAARATSRSSPSSKWYWPCLCSLH